MIDSLGEFLNNISPADIEKLKLLSSIFGSNVSFNLTEKSLSSGIAEYEDFASYKLEPKTITLIKTANRRLLSALPGKRQLHTIAKKDAERVFRENSKTAPKGAFNYNRVYHSMFNQFKEWNYIPVNPFDFKKPKVQKEEPISIPQNELNLICSTLSGMNKPVISDMVLFAVETGLRLGEQINLRWSDVDLKNKIITIGNKFFKTKTKRIRKIPFNSKTESILNSASALQLTKSKILREFVFTQNNGKPWRGDTVSKSFKKACRKNNLPEEYHWHTLRSTAASNWVNRRVPIYTVQKLLGHLNVRTTQIYAKVDIEELRNAVNQL